MRRLRKRRVSSSGNGKVIENDQNAFYKSYDYERPDIRKAIAPTRNGKRLDIPTIGSSKNMTGLEVGVSGLKIASGYIHEEFLPELRGSRGRRVYREMSDNDAVIGAILFAIKMAVRAVPWNIERCDANDDSEEALQAVDWLEGVLFEDMETPFPEFISEVLSMLTYGWSLFEIVFKRRVGPYETKPEKQSSFSDGAIGIRKLAARGQDSLERWDIGANGEILGFIQNTSSFMVAGSKSGFTYIPENKFLLFRPESYKNNPEGRSVLRNAYRSWYYYKNIQNIEAIAIERELAGLPVLRLPNALLKSTNEGDAAVLQTYTQMIRDLKLNEQGGVIIPSDVYKTQDGQLSTIPKVQFELMTSGGSRAIDTTKVLMRYEFAMSRVVLADFVMLGTSEKGSYALSKSKSDMFFNGLKGWMEAIASVINRKLIPRLWQYNGFDSAYMPRIRPGRMAIENLDEISTFIKTLTDSGATLFPDDDLESYLRELSGLPERSEDLDLEGERMQYQQAINDEEEDVDDLEDLEEEEEEE